MKLVLFKNIDASFDEAIERATTALQNEGFGVLIEIDVRAILKKKLMLTYIS